VSIDAEARSLSQEAAQIGDTIVGASGD